MSKTVSTFLRLIGVQALLVAASAAALGAQMYTTLFTFPCSGVDGGGADASLIQDTDGNLYGTTYLGGNASGGTVYTHRLLLSETHVESLRLLKRQEYFEIRIVP
jgi:hypothetical protein